MPALKNQRHELFAQALAEGLSGTQAYLKAGYEVGDNVARASAPRLLANIAIQERVAELQERLTAKAVITRTWVLEKLAKNAMIALGEEKIKVTRISKTKIADESGGFTEAFETVELEVTERDPAACNRALELLGREAEGPSMFVERKEIGNPGDFANVSTDELKSRLHRLAAQLGGSSENSDGIEFEGESGSLH